MDDIQVNVDDDFLHSDLRSTYGYEKALVDFNGVQELQNCKYLGGKHFREKN
ncbi:MAG: hypothetical protein KJO63_03555 [Maribacter sp.]|nr:hypothetical protein [Maribacter sp.]